MRKYSEILEILKKKESQAILISNPYNMRYLSGFSGGEGYLYISECRQCIIVDARYTLWAKNECDIDVITIDRDFYHAINMLVSSDAADTILLEGKHLTYMQYKRFEENLSINIKCLNDEVDRLRMIKDEEEIGYIREAEKIGDEAFSYILGELYEGISEKEVAYKLEMYMRTHGAESLSFESIAASGPNSASPHAMPSDRKLKSGDMFTMDFGCVYNGYCSDMTRTVVIGKASEKQKEVYDIVLKAQQHAINNICAGTSGCDADAYARDIIEEAGYADCFGHGLGHGVGLFIHEEPRLSKKSEEILVPGNVVTVEPGIYIPGEFGVRIEDIIVIRDSGIENLTFSDKALIEI